MKISNNIEILQLTKFMNQSKINQKLYVCFSKDHISRRMLRFSKLSTLSLKISHELKKTRAKNSNSDRYIDVIDAKLFAIEKTIEVCAKKAYSIKLASNIWVFTYCANAITRLEKFEFRTHLMKKLHRNCKELYEIDHKIHIYWVSRHAKISRNLQTDEQAKKELKKIENQDNFMSFQYLNKRIKSDKIEKWNSMWQKNTNKDEYYKLHNSNSQ